MEITAKDVLYGVSIIVLGIALVAVQNNLFDLEKSLEQKTDFISQLENCSRPFMFKYVSYPVTHSVETPFYYGESHEFHDETLYLRNIVFNDGCHYTGELYWKPGGTP